MKFILNGIEKEYNGDVELSLLRYLRDIEGITSPKDVLLNLTVKQYFHV